MSQAADGVPATYTHPDTMARADEKRHTADACRPCMLPSRLDVVRMNTCVWIDENLRVIHSFVYVTESCQTVVGGPLVAPNAAPGYHVSLYDRIQCSSTAIWNQVHKELARRNVNSTENPLSWNGSGMTVSWFSTGYHGLVYGDYVPLSTQLNWIAQQVEGAQVAHKREPIGHRLVLQIHLTFHLGVRTINCPVVRKVKQLLEWQMGTLKKAALPYRHRGPASLRRTTPNYSVLHTSVHGLVHTGSAFRTVHLSGE